jgi:hypothetical protein
MTMQYDVKGSHNSGSGFMVSGRVRLKNLIYLGTGTAGSIDIFDTAIAPVTATYARSGYTVTVTSTAHGLSTGQIVGITFAAASSISATAGNYVITRLTADTFTITDINTGTIAGGTACVYVSNAIANTNSVYLNKWLTSYNTGTAVQPFQVLFQGEGMLVNNGVYASVTNIAWQTIQYG